MVKIKEQHIVLLITLILVRGLINTVKGLRLLMVTMLLLHLTLLIIIKINRRSLLRTDMAKHRRGHSSLHLVVAKQQKLMKQ